MTRMAYWLLKSEPGTYSIDDLEREGVAEWDGVRNYQARNHLRAMRVGDRAFFYHSNASPAGVAGICEVVREAYPDHTAWDPASPYHDPRSGPEKPIWYMPDVCFIRKLPRMVTLKEIKGTPSLEEMALVHKPRLSVQPVTEGEWETIVELGERP